MASVPLAVANVFALPEGVPVDRAREIVSTRTLTRDEMVTFRLDVPTLYRLGLNFRHMLWHWGEPPAAANLLWENMREDRSVLCEVKYALTHRAVADRFPELDWFAMGLTVHDMLYLRMHDIDTLLLFRVDLLKLLHHGAWEHGRAWSEAVGWKEIDLKRLGYTREKFQAFVAEEGRRNPLFSAELAEAFVHTGQRGVARRGPPRLQNAATLFGGAQSEDEADAEAPARTRWRWPWT
tara:strand:- start:270 stop:980 length:711 start_codon:yes stop_codon:yes gene_type:complete